MSEGGDVIMGSTDGTDLTGKRGDSNCEKYEVGGGKHSFHGVEYQLNLLILFILRGLTEEYPFAIATEMKNAGKFDDVILRTEKKSGGYSYRLLQSKHKGGESSKNITTQGLFSNNLKGDYSIRAYLESYLEMRPRFTSGQDEIRDLIICTNGKFKSKDRFGTFTLKDAFEETEKLDEIFQVKLMRLNEEGKRITKDFLKCQYKEIVPSESDFDSFLAKLHFAMSQSGNADLRKKNVLLLQTLCGIGDIEIAYQQFESKIRTWMYSPVGIYFDRKEAVKLIQSLKDKFGDLIFGFDDPVSTFIGRERELKEMEEVWGNGSKNIIAIYGLGGMGKTELARKFIANNTNFKRIVWVTSDSQGSLINSFQRLAERLGIGVEGKQMKTITEEIYACFSDKKSVFVFDNVEISSIQTENNHYIKDFLPIKSDGPFVILTSRFQWHWENAHKLLLNEIEQDDAKNFITSNIPSECLSSDNSATKLAKQLQNFPLALQQAVAYIIKKYEYSVYFGDSYSIDNYLQTFEEETSQVLNCDILSSSTPNYDKTTMTTWIVTFREIEKIDNKAVKILDLIAYFAPDKIDANNIFLYFDGTKEEMKKSLILLKEFSIIGLFKNKISIHRLVQKVIILRLKGKGKYEETLRWVLKYVLDLELEQKISLWEKLVEYKKIQLEYAYLPFQIMKSLMSSSRYEQAYFYGKKSVANLKETCEFTNSHLLDAMKKFAWVSYLNMCIEEALTVYKDILNRIITKFKIHSVSRVAPNHGELNDDSRNGELNDDSRICELNDDSRIGEIKESCPTLGVANSYLNSDYVTNVLMILDDLVVVEDFEKEIYKQNLPRLFDAINGILKCNSNLGDKNNVVVLFQKVYDKERKMLGVNHKITLEAKHEIALLHSNLGDKSKALMLLEEVYEQSRKFRGENKKNTLSTKYEIALLHSDLGNEEKALTFLEEVYEASRETLGADHEHTLATKHEIAMHHKRFGNESKALEILEEVYAKRMEIVGENQKNTLATKHEMAILYSYLGDQSYALKLLEDVYEKRVRILGENHLNTLATKHEVAMLHYRMGEKTKALMLLEEAYNNTIGVCRENHGNTLTIKHDIAVIHSNSHDETKALGLLEEVYNKRLKTLGESNENTLATKLEMALCHSKLGDKTKALKLLKEVYEKQKTILGENHINTLNTMYEIGILHYELGENSRALMVLEEVYKKEKNIFGEDHSNTQSTLKVITELKLRNETSVQCVRYS